MKYIIDITDKHEKIELEGTANEIIDSFLLTYDKVLKALPYEMRLVFMNEISDINLDLLKTNSKNKYPPDESLRIKTKQA